jgi:FixJ family two-component response regulator
MRDAKVCDKFERATSTSEPATVHVIDIGASRPRSMAALIELAGWRVETHASAEAVLARTHGAGAGCILLDADMLNGDGMSDLDMIARIAREIPAIILGRPDVAAAVGAIKAGAVEFLPKPISAWTLLHAIDQAIALSYALLDEHLAIRHLRAHYALLSQRERQVMALIAQGLLNKQVGGELGISEITVKAHRGQVMRKMKAQSFAELVNMATALGLPRSTGARHSWRYPAERYNGVAETFA